MEPLWRIEMLGWLRVVPAGDRDGGRALTRFRSRKGAALLAYLAHHARHPQPRERLIELLWPGVCEPAGRCSLRTELSWLRGRLEPPGVPAGSVLVTDGGAVQLSPAACVTDVAAFEAALRSAAGAGSGAERARWLREAAERYRGELLPGLFETWVVPERLRLLDAYLDGVDELVREREAAGDRAGALQWAWRAAGIDPLQAMTACEGEARRLPSDPADRERCLRQQRHAQTAKIEALRQQLAAQTEAVEVLRWRLAAEQAETRKLQQQLAAAPDEEPR